MVLEALVTALLTGLIESGTVELTADADVPPSLLSM